MLKITICGFQHVGLALVGVISMIADFFLRWSFCGSREERGTLQLLLCASCSHHRAGIAASCFIVINSRRREYLVMLLVP